jgi:hypothetical protein
MKSGERYISNTRQSDAAGQENGLDSDFWLLRNFVCCIFRTFGHCAKFFSSRFTTQTASILSFSCHPSVCLLLASLLPTFSFFRLSSLSSPGKLTDVIHRNKDLILLSIPGSARSAMETVCLTLYWTEHSLRVVLKLVRCWAYTCNTVG